MTVDATRPPDADGTRPAIVSMDVVEAARAGDQAAFEEIFRTYQPGLLRYFRSVIPAHADDVAAATWESVASSLRGFRGDGPGFRRWLFTIARRRVVDQVRREVRWPRRLFAVPDELDDLDGAPPADAAHDDPDWAANVLCQIPPRQAEAVALRVIGGLSVDETARRLSTTPENVRVLSHRGLAAIRRILVDEPAEVGAEISLVV